LLRRHRRHSLDFDRRHSRTFLRSDLGLARRSGVRVSPVLQTFAVAATAAAAATAPAPAGAPILAVIAVRCRRLLAKPRDLGGSFGSRLR
jgi:hypothetical protein